jgi:hypothetical protein
MTSLNSAPAPTPPTSGSAYTSSNSACCDSQRARTAPKPGGVQSGSKPTVDRLEGLRAFRDPGSDFGGDLRVKAQCVLEQPQQIGQRACFWALPLLC